MILLVISALVHESIALLALHPGTFILSDARNGLTFIACGWIELLVRGRSAHVSDSCNKAGNRVQEMILLFFIWNNFSAFRKKSQPKRK